MKICIIAEGSYPYITGGVSSWIHMLTSWMPEHEFIIYAIGANHADKGKFSYTLPDNVIKVEEVFMDEFLQETGNWGKKYKLSSTEKDALKALLLGKKLNWGYLFDFISSNRFQTASDFLMGKEFFDILQEVYEELYPLTSFVDFFWTMRSMLVPLFLIIKHKVPQADLYHSVSTGYAGIVGSLGSHMYKKPFILTEHGIYTREREEEIIKSDWVKGYLKDVWIEFFYSLSRCAYDNATKVLTLFNKNKQIQIELGCEARKLHIIPNGVEIENFKSIPLKDDNDTYINIGAVVRVVPIKDIKTMIQGFALAKMKVHNARLFIMGPTEEDPEYYTECTQLVEALDVKDVIFTGKVNVKDYLGKMDILLLSSISEGQPLAVLEAMACAKPFISTDVGSCKELLYGNDDNLGQAGIVVPIMDYEKMADALILLSNNSNLRLQMGTNGFNRVTELYNKQRFLLSYRELYNSYQVV